MRLYWQLWIKVLRTGIKDCLKRWGCPLSAKICRIWTFSQGVMACVFCSGRQLRGNGIRLARLKSWWTICRLPGWNNSMSAIISRCVRCTKLKSMMLTTLTTWTILKNMISLGAKNSLCTKSSHKGTKHLWRSLWIQRKLKEKMDKLKFLVSKDRSAPHKNLCSSQLHSLALRAIASSLWWSNWERINGNQYINQKSCNQLAKI